MAIETQGNRHLRFWTSREYVYINSYVYVIQGQGTEPVKVGLAKNVPTRMAELQTGNPFKLRLLHVLIGDRRLEWNLHKRLAGNRIHGEWFVGERVDVLLEEIADMADRMVAAFLADKKLPDYNDFGRWKSPVRVKGASTLEVSFVDPESLRPSAEQAAERERRDKDAAVLRNARVSAMSPFNSEIDKVPVHKDKELPAFKRR